MSTEAFFLMSIGLLLLFALIGGIVINRSWKQEEKEKSVGQQNPKRVS